MIMTALLAWFVLWISVVGFVASARNLREDDFPGKPQRRNRA
jgi:hypothetical protein